MVHINEELTIINEILDEIDNYEKQTGIKNPPVYIGREMLVTLQQVLTTKSKKELAFDIIKEKLVNILILELAETVEEHNEIMVANSLKLTKEEFDTLKEVKHE